MIDHKKGCLTKAFETKDLAEGIVWILRNDKRWKILSKRASKKIEQEFELKQVAKGYFNLYNDILAKKHDI